MRRAHPWVARSVMGGAATRRRCVADRGRAGTHRSAFATLGCAHRTALTAADGGRCNATKGIESPGSRRVSVALLRILDRAGFDPLDAVPLLQALTGMLLGPAVHRATYAAAAARMGSRGPSESPGRVAGGEPDWRVDQLSAWAADPDADRLVVELWVAGVEGLATRQPRAGDRGD